MTRNPFAVVHSQAAAQTDDLQERNRAWWERLPMTYESWSNADRSTSRERAVTKFLSGNPWLARTYFSRFAGKNVLEIGCGAGPATCLFAEGGAKITAVDLTDVAVQLTKIHTDGLSVIVERMDAEHMSFADASFDHVFSWGVLHHSANTEKALAEVARILKPDGTGLIMVYNRASARYWIKGLIWLVLRGKALRGESLSSVQRFFTDGYFHRHFTPSELTRALLPLKVERIAVTHMAGRMLPLVPRALDEWCKQRWGWLLIAEVRKRPGQSRAMG